MTGPAQGLFDGPAPRIRAAPAGAPFLDLIAGAMVDALYRADDPFALSDALVLLPNRRAQAGLVQAFAKRLGGAALLPTIRPLGDPYADDDPDVWGAESFETPPQIPKMRRRMQLASLIRRRDKAENGVEDPARALALADELAKLLDSAATVEQVKWDLLPKLVEEIDLARHWDASAKFLAIIAQFWPQHLKDEGLSDFAAYGADLRRALTARWRADPPERPIIIAGSTGSIATTRDLMRVVAGLPRGVVILPGVDVDMDDQSWRLVSDQHPQHALKATLDALGVDRRDVAPLGEENGHARARRLLMREALAPAERTADWLQRLADAGGAAFVQAGAAGLSLLEAETEDEEAAAIALMLRQALETPGRTAALATPDAKLALRVEAKLARWGVAPAVSHGRPLGETEAGALVALLCELALDPAEPVALAALLKHPRVSLSSSAGARTALEHLALRGPRRHETLADLEASESLAKVQFARELVGKVAIALKPLNDLMAKREISLRDFADALAQAAENLGGGAVWQGLDGDAVAKKVLAEAINHGQELGPMRAREAPRVLMKLLEPETEPRLSGGEARIAIWGTLEARLQRRDLMILGGLNEGVWPAPPGEDPFLSRSMRARLGLPSLDERIGLAAHDFAQLANAPEVVLTRALRREGSPTLASRWLWRLKTLVEGAKTEIARADAPLAWARALNAPEAPRDARIPKPKPPPGKRIKRLSVTQVETLIRDPYAFYARRILGFEVLKPIGAEAGPAERGAALHKAIERFEDGDEHGLLVRLIDEELARAGISAERRMAERERLQISVKALIAWFAERRARNPQIYRERKGELNLGDVVLSGVADRIEIAPGFAAILDFKTGLPPTDKQVESGLAPQLLLEAAMLARGAFKDLAAAQVSELVYFRFGNAEPTPRAVSVDSGPAAAGEKALASLEALLAKYEQPTQAFLSKPRVLKIRLYDDYDQLARRKEWADAEGDE